VLEIEQFLIKTRVDFGLAFFYIRLKPTGKYFLSLWYVFEKPVAAVEEADKG
jgi:hypothetical protein